jgi:hypothetical protein
MANPRLPCDGNPHVLSTIYTMTPTFHDHVLEEHEYRQRDVNQGTPMPI